MKLRQTKRGILADSVRLLRLNVMWLVWVLSLLRVSTGPSKLRGVAEAKLY